MTEHLPRGALAGIRILDLTRVLAGPTATQILGDLGAEVIKIERPAIGDDTRRWGPPFVKDAAGKDTTESTYYLGANRNKRSLTVDIAQPEGQALVKRLLKDCQVLVENYKVGGLAKYGLAFEQLKAEFPALVYCSVTGFGQTGPRAEQPGYDYLAQGMGGLMSVTGPADGVPTKVGTAIADIMTGMYAVTGILAALRHAERTGEGQQVDVCLLDSQIAALAYVATFYLNAGRLPARQGNGHPTIVPYNTYSCADGQMVILATGNDGHWQRFCAVAGRPELAADPRFASNAQRVRNRAAIEPLLAAIFREQPVAWWVDRLEAVEVPASPVLTIDQVFAEPQVQHRQMDVALPHPLAGSGSVRLVGSPLKMSATPVTYRAAPPTLGQDSDTVLQQLLGLAPDEIAALRARGVV
ncbi:MAG: CoA transferase [Alphaproteobacteria bacterium]|nr:CoA transferase [Alphaproteobacteria bacterium]